jgi:glutathione S-transferase
VRADVARLVSMWGGLLAAYPRQAGAGGDQHFLFGDFSIADAFFAPVCMRLRTYALPLPSEIAAYVERVAAAPGVKAWIDDALAEHDFLQFEEPYRTAADVVKK